MRRLPAFPSNNTEWPHAANEYDMHQGMHVAFLMHLSVCNCFTSIEDRTYSSRLQRC